MARGLFSSTAAPCLKCHATGDAAHDKNATAPNFLLARERLKPDWVERWIIDPQAISPGTAMPSGLFKRENNRWVFAGPTPSSFRGYDNDHTKLLEDYIFQLTPEEQRRVAGAMGGSQTSRNGARLPKPAGGSAPGRPRSNMAKVSSQFQERYWGIMKRKPFLLSLGLCALVGLVLLSAC